MPAKNDKGKTDYSLVPAMALDMVAEVFTKGLETHPKDSWRTIENPEARYFAACMRHLTEWRLGNVLDKDSKQPHLAHAATNLIFLLELQLSEIQSNPS